MYSQNDSEMDKRIRAHNPHVDENVGLNAMLFQLDGEVQVPLPTMWNNDDKNNLVKISHGALRVHYPDNGEPITNGTTLLQFFTQYLHSQTRKSLGLFVPIILSLYYVDYTTTRCIL